ncbi:endonuclease/exonuclease/phosphatase [Thermoanaerobacterium thermosaccharolyticum]|uniref:endonuclease/exonuclease/phosphatase family protein n=1 Tax=Thermoanaerobacterium thermosaccharolyticum TaxID=1517 RepID=UPI000C0857A8|nr:endonuclease/exonuclease/phosphatase family protein [Thermoanaerobacterium thermosaccharolyticum]PHO08012.1 endonuclease/exonuclease/phosphatase [Thermoanaerobacterium thermosaccharolyticum]
MTINILTWNIKAGQNKDGGYPDPKTENLDKIADEIKTSRASIVCLQEVDAYTIRSGTNIHQAEYISNKLTAITGTTWNYKYITSINMNPGYYGNAIISSCSLTTALRVYLSKVNSSENRSFLLVRVDFGSSYFYVGTAHLGLNGDQVIQAQKIKDELNNNGFSNERLIIGCDLNDGENSDTYNIMLNNVFSMVDSGPAGICTLECYNNSNNPKIDFLFNCGTSIDATKSKVLQVDISDHCPVMAYIND